jgi:hypothetical protein
MKRMLFAAAVAVAAMLALTAGTARADRAVHLTFSFSGQFFSPTGTLCDFNEQDTFTVDGIENIAPNGQDVVVLTIYVTHTNLDTTYSLTEVDHATFVMQLGKGTFVNAGIFWHLRDPSGKTVLVKAGEATFDATTGQLLKFTPNSAFDQLGSDILCPALGGSSA